LRNYTIIFVVFVHLLEIVCGFFRLLWVRFNFKPIIAEFLIKIKVGGAGRYDRTVIPIIYYDDVFEEHQQNQIQEN